jgi:H+/Cl- antiporter ClcA
MCGMSAVFAALFGCPLTAAIFAMEVASVGIIHFSGVVPCLTASLTASYLAKFLGVSPERFPVIYIPPLTIGRVGSVVLIAAVGALVSIFFCVFLHKGEHFFAKHFPNRHVRILVGGSAIAVCVWILGTTEYCGAGIHTIQAAIEGQADIQDFALKILFTVLAVSAGYKGGEIVPAMFIGSTLGCVLGDWLGLPPGVGAAVGLISLFCGSLNCPISSLLLGAELFGSAGLRYYAIACAVSLMRLL